MNVVFVDKYVYFHHRINATWASNVLAPSGILSTQLGQLFANVHQAIQPKGFDGAIFGTSVLTKDDEYAPLYGRLLVSWVNQDTYKPLYDKVMANFFGKAISPNSINNLSFGRPLIYNGIKIQSQGFDTQTFGQAIIADEKAYTPKYHALNVTWWQEPTYRRQIVSSWYNKTVVYVNGFESLSISTPAIATHQAISPKGFDAGEFGGHYVLHHWQYMPNKHLLNASWLGKLPHQNPVSHAFYVAWFIPSDNLNIGTIGIDGLMIGIPTLISYLAIMEPTGFEIRHHFGQASITNRARLIKTGNLYPPDVPRPTIKLRQKFIKQVGLNVGAFGQARLDFYHRTLKVQGIPSSLNFGRAWISHYTRTIIPKSIDSVAPPKPAISTTQHITPIGFVATLWLTRIIPESQSIYPQGMMGEFGQAVIKNHRQYVSLRGFDNQAFGQSDIYNLRQYIHVVNDEQSELSPNGKSKGFGRWTSIENKNKVIHTFGFAHDVFGRASIDNQARVIKPMGFDGLAMGTPTIGDKVRYIKIDGIEPPHISRWNIVYNDARELHAIGFKNQTVFGTLAVVNTRRILTHIGGFDVGEFGLPMIADRVRTVALEPRYSIAPPTIPLPTIHLHTRYINAKSSDMAKFGVPNLHIHWNIISPRWHHRDFVGEPTIKNLTPEIPIFGHDSQEFGQVNIRNEFVHIYPKSHESLAMGIATIKDRRQKMAVMGFGGTKFGHHRIIKEIPPYHPQWIDLNRYNDKDEPVGGYGIGSSLSFGTPSMNERAIKVKGFGGAKFGTPAIRTNTIQMRSGIFEPKLGTPTIILNRRVISIDDQQSISSKLVFGTPRMSPHTIYAPSGDMATLQARRNHPPRNTHVINSMTVFGRATITNKNRTIQAYGQSSSMVGRPTIVNALHFIKPYGFRLSKFGIPTIPFAPQHIQVIDGIDSAEFGRATIKHQESLTQYIKPKGIVGEFGRLVIENKNRTISPIGFVATRMGQPRPNDTPFMWQGLRIGERVLGNYGGLDSTVFGTAWISNKIREIHVQGWDSFVSEPTLGSFKGRLTLRRVVDGLPKKGKTAQVIGAIPIAPPAPPVPNIKNKVHYIRPDGNSEQFRKGAW
ncbi:hypothetical protein [Moraxella bovis]|uniref:hypothetical protein n=1 Tax=Moraxella bovis TaxID=476 RepID=UPI000993A8F5|nr:hypothetical protein [Moraxella bovis]OOR87078.1 hypothetical protein B0182_13195 [Moraxella bovis]UZA18334.1 hypothetical protein LP088_08175 [Moraxella bovis]